MTHFQFSWEEDLKLRLRFLELLFLISTLLVGLNPNQITSLTASILLLFIIFGALHYFVVSNGLLDGKLLIVTAALTSYSFAATYASVFFNLEVLELVSSIGYFAIIGFMIGIGILPKRVSYKVISMVNKLNPMS